MQIIVLDTLCARHPASPYAVTPTVGEAVHEGTVSGVTVLGGEDAPGQDAPGQDAPGQDGPGDWPGLVRRVPVRGTRQRLRALAAALREEAGRVLVVDCSCAIRPETLAAFANLATSTALVTDRRDLPVRAGAVVRHEGRAPLVLDRLAAPDDRCEDGETFGYLGSAVLLNADRTALADILDARPGPPSWRVALGRLARRVRVQCAVLAQDIHGHDIVVENRLAGGSYARTYVHLHRQGRRIVRKEAFGEGQDKLSEEIGWLRGLDDSARRHFPDVVEHRIETRGASMDLRYHPLPTLRGLILSGAIDEEEAALWARRILAVVKRDLYPAGERDVPEGYIRRTHLDRVARRLAETAAALPRRHRLWEAERVRVNGVWLRNVRHVVADLGRDERMLGLLTPRRLLRTHGDLHFDNVLIDRSNHRFLLIDPRGNPGYDVAYDLGKVWHSVNSLYDLIHGGHVEVTVGEKEIDYTLTAPELVAFYRAVRRRLYHWLTATHWHRGEPHWLLKVRLAEAAHMCSVMPFHIAHDERETVALACYARGVELINELYGDLAEEAGRRTGTRLAPVS
ncbi:hypothetical protein SGM_4179 [Streptomyces griseoaurantiacus M045]|uniref:Aminoglycoside phosphotransferase domain-containing protein n=1 Tax=Streptomyces griseoaurantiacus M045 TaxID=996637 RepID=F3NLS4_9ACTN|nr:phosphotransferase [Streptomyces griseoaurantiacus]EGG45474.1 hypothetical protein SGM_4179 [Streptomyces griseoaurantiacus M045]